MLTQEQFGMHKEQASMIISEISMKFTKKFSSHCYVGEVIKILLNGKWSRIFNDNACEQCSHDQLENISNAISDINVIFDDDRNDHAHESEEGIKKHQLIIVMMSLKTSLKHVIW